MIRTTIVGPVSAVVEEEVAGGAGLLVCATNEDEAAVVSFARRDSSSKRRERAVSNEGRGSVCWIIAATISKSVFTSPETKRITNFCSDTG